MFNKLRLRPLLVKIFLVKMFEFLLCFELYLHRWAATWQNQQSVCAPSEDSDQPRHPSRLIRVFAVRMKKDWVLSYPLSANEDSDQTGRMPRLIWDFARRTLTLLVLTCRGSDQVLTLTDEELTKLEERLEADEGVSYTVYNDSRGFLTFGIGHKITENDPEHGKPIGLYRVKQKEKTRKLW